MRAPTRDEELRVRRADCISKNRYAPNGHRWSALVRAGTDKPVGVACDHCLLTLRADQWTDTGPWPT